MESLKRRKGVMFILETEQGGLLKELIAWAGEL